MSASTNLEFDTSFSIMNAALTCEHRSGKGKKTFSALEHDPLLRPS